MNRKMKLKIGAVVVLGLTVASGFAAVRKGYYCKYCGLKYATIGALSATECARHPSGGRHHHELYQGTEKDVYECQFCGKSARDIRTLTATKCHRHPDGVFKGRHIPAL